MNGAKPARLPTLTITPKRLTAPDTRECSTWNIIQCSAAFITLGEFEINAVHGGFQSAKETSSIPLPRSGLHEDSQEHKEQRLQASSLIHEPRNAGVFHVEQ